MCFEVRVVSERIHSPRNELHTYAWPRDIKFGMLPATVGPLEDARRQSRDVTPPLSILVPSFRLP
jgi:hypothetical protein